MQVHKLLPHNLNWCYPTELYLLEFKDGNIAGEYSKCVQHLFKNCGREIRKINLISTGSSGLLYSTFLYLQLREEGFHVATELYHIRQATSSHFQPALTKLNAEYSLNIIVDDTVSTGATLKRILKKIKNVEGTPLKEVDGLIITCLDYEGLISKIEKATTEAGIPILNLYIKQD